MPLSWFLLLNGTLTLQKPQFSAEASAASQDDTKMTTCTPCHDVSAALLYLHCDVQGYKEKSLHDNVTMQISSLASPHPLWMPTALCGFREVEPSG